MVRTSNSIRRLLFHCFRHTACLHVAHSLVTVSAQATTQPCPAPHLDKGYVVPEEDRYYPNSFISYACDSGHKPAVEGWWATSRCQNGVWSPTPQCISKYYNRCWEFLGLTDADRLTSAVCSRVVLYIHPRKLLHHLDYKTKVRQNVIVGEPSPAFSWTQHLSFLTGPAQMSTVPLVCFYCHCISLLSQPKYPFCFPLSVLPRLFLPLPFP